MAKQTEVAEHLGITDRMVRELQTKPGAPVPRGRGSHDLDAWRYWYIEYLRSNSRRGVSEDEPEDNDGDEMRAAKLRAQLLQIDEREEKLELAKLNRKIKAKEYAPLFFIRDAVESVSVAMRTRVDGWMPRIMRACPDLPIEAQEVINKELILLQNEITDVRPDFSRYVDGSGEAGGDGSLAAEEESAPDGG